MRTWEADILKNLRKKKGWTQKEFAEWLEIPLITLAKWECGSTKPPLYIIKLIQFKCENDTDQIKIFEVIK